MLTFRNIVTFSSILGFISLDSTSAFAPLPNTVSISPRFASNAVSETVMSAKKPSGSFFNQVPDKDDEDKNNKSDEQQNMTPSPGGESVPIEESWAKMLESRQTSRASQPSTLGGIPTSQATGKIWN